MANVVAFHFSISERCAWCCGYAVYQQKIEAFRCIGNDEMQQLVVLDKHFV
jgi:hypothetical protein